MPVETSKNRGHLEHHAGITERMRRLLGILLLLFTLITASPAFAQATVSYPLNLGVGWNLLGNSLSSSVAVKTVYGNNGSGDTRFTTVWKWLPGSRKWAFYAPSLDAKGGTALADYCASKGYSVLTSIDPGEGYWVNATQAVSLGTQSGPGYSLGKAALSVGWNLVATADNISPADFNRSLSGAPGGSFPTNVTTLWAWDNVNSLWRFYAPTLDAQGGTVLANYIASKGYENFNTLTLGQGLGFWANLPAPGPAPITYLTGTATYTASPAGSATAYSNFPTLVTFSPNVSIPPGAEITNVHWEYSTGSSTSSRFIALFCPDSALINCVDITRYQSFSTLQFNGLSPNRDWVIAVLFSGNTPPPSPVSIWNYSVTAAYKYPASTALVNQRVSMSTLLAPVQAEVVVDPLAPPPTAGSQ